MHTIASLPYLKWSDVIDILLISFLLHRLLVLFRGTTTLHVSTAIALLWLLQGIAHHFNFILTSRFLEATGTAAVLVIVVAFRDEIREVLMQTNPVRLFVGRPSAKPEAKRLHAAVEACFHLAETRTGALLVFQNRDRLGEFVRDGVLFGGRVSVPILGSVFAKESPVHDGAAIVRGNSIDRVGAILPLTRRTDLPPEYGTRHRAAIGLSDVCDAVVVVVSEERGEVSVVHRGVVTRAETAAGLEQFLRERLGWAGEDGRRLQAARREFLRQVGGFLVTCAAVSAYWFIVFGQQASVTNLSVPIDFRDVPEGLEVGFVSRERVDVQIRGRGPLIEDLKLRPEQVGVGVDLGGYSPGEGQAVHLGPEDVELPVGLEVVRIDPSTLTVDLDRRADKEVEVRPQFEGEIPEGYEIALAPARVRIVGPATSLARIDAIATERSPLPDLRADPAQTTLTLDLRALPGSVRLDEDQPRRVRVTIRRAPPPKPAPDPPKPADPAENGPPAPSEA